MKTLIKPFALAALSCALLSACAVGPDYQKPTQVGAIQLELENRPEHPLALSENRLTWWTQFNDVTLNQLVHTAIEENRSIQQAQWNAQRAYAVFSEQSLQEIPQGYVTATTQSFKNADAAIGTQNRVRSENLTLNLSWDLDLFGKLQRASEAALARAEQADILWQEAQLQIVSQVVSAYGQYRGAELRWVVAQLNLQFLLQSQDIIDAQLQAGVATEFELAQIQAQVQQVKATIPALKQQEYTAKATLAALLGNTLADLALSPSQTIPALSRPIALTLDKNALKYRSDVAAAERELAASHADIGVATADLYPTISVNGFLGYLGSPDLAFNRANESWRFAPTLNWSGINYGSVKTRIRQADASAQMALFAFEQSVINAVNDMQLSLKNYELSQQSVAINHQLFEATEKAVNIARARYKAGTIDFLQLLDSERQVLASRDQLALAQVQHFLHLVDIYRSFNGALPIAANSAAPFAASLALSDATATQETRLTDKGDTP